MIKRLRDFARKDDAVIEVFSEILLTGIIVLAIAAAAAFVLSSLDEPDNVRVDIDHWVDNETDTLYFRHSGGETVEVEDLEILVYVNGSYETFTSGQIRANYDSDEWALGDVIEINTSSQFNYDIDEDNVPSKLVHTASSLVIYDAYGSIGDSGDSGNGGSGPQNQPPVASFSYSPSLTPMGQSITFDASASYDPDGSITSYEWDWTNDGSYDATGVTATHSYSTPGSYDVKLRVADDDGETATTSETVVVIGPLVYLNDAIALDIDSDGTPSGVQFNVRNYGDEDLTVVSINITPENATVGGLNDPEGGIGQWESEFYVESDGFGYTTDFGYGETLPYTFDLSEANNANDEPVLAANSNATFSLYQFTDGSGGGTSSGAPIDIAGESVDITLIMADGSSYNFTIKPSGPPQADAGGDFTIDEGTTGMLDGSGSSDPGGNIVTYEWTITDNPGGASVSITDADNTDPTATFDASGADVDGDQVVEVTLTVTNDDGVKASDVVEVTVNDLDVPAISYIQGSGLPDAFYGKGSLEFEISNNEDSPVTIQNISVTTTDSAARRIDNSGWASEVLIYGGTTLGYRNGQFQLGDVASLDINAQVDASSDVNVVLRDFVNNGGNEVWVSGDTIYVTFGMTDGRQVTVTIDDI
ncbi:type IV pilin N-terminal domain-containing protein [Methanohalophilus halophilus]|uniref:PKD domain-containing protein n=1 Tax=Methanohalophilus halophilus TaxID=2177 RepID=A0A1L3Q0P6_9EURY|nr:type IV pilin N-terminal domain-containing protein [Methanohalophilus halophilus]APH38454.1 hypothetical protein BHR79_02425 [Methanohalophilus halophilus]RNI10670.1 PKD domain-containing protein [Methanohalophilus halophilus]SDW08657.1 PKD domain-containing protein [Methanohalophilus halophilus]